MIGIYHSLQTIQMGTGGLILKDQIRLIKPGRVSVSKLGGCFLRTLIFGKQKIDL